MTTFFIDPPAVTILASRFDRAATTAEDLAAELATFLRIVANLSGETSVPVVSPRLRSLADTWSILATSLRDRVAQLEAAALTAADFADLDLVQDLRDATFEEARLGVLEQIEELLKTTPPLIIRGAKILQAQEQVQLGGGDDEWRTYHYYIDENGRRVKVKIEGDRVVTREGEFPIVSTPNGRVILFEGQTAVERVQANLNGEGDGSTPTVGDLFEDEFFKSATDPSRPPGTEVRFPVYTIGDANFPDEITKEKVLEFVRQISKLPGGEAFLDTVATPVLEFFLSGKDDKNFGDNVKDLFDAVVEAVGNFVDRVVDVVTGDGSDDGGGGSSESGGGYDDGWGGGYGTENDGDYDNNYSGI